ncbi:MAG TPA: formate dehydrogenase accessory sulfurtransferase FdhD [Dokdonella sp.]|uniref:formate dehydrogenase accessory sulfurtransferase FdhD n=1 Tax=Dokdonella sp. TaxID=2291710 RepID=UPI002D7ECFC7|nr:formate dehydrogenase accessory sulfurtransferase FdhD [Dokdonella sp.]HET9031763.1 formate dehydrogenase accessory sulfurtransferase FdhD [Dokdonella sp.]
MGSREWDSSADAETGCVRRRVARFEDGSIEQTEDWIASEVPIAMSYNGEAHVVMLATPMDLQDFALGFSLSEAIIASSSELETIRIDQRLEGIEIGMQIPQPRAEAIAARQRNLSGRSSCGLCGTQQLEDVLRHPPTLTAAIAITADAMHRALNSLAAAQPLNLRTGATHAAAWSDIDGSLQLVREDVGRHNALDKLVGAMTRQAIDVQRGFLILTSRASYEMVQKSATVGIGLIAAISAPTALAIHLAESCGVTLIGFARDDGHVVYTHPQRIVEQDT